MDQETALRGTRPGKMAYLFKQVEVQDPSKWRWRRGQGFGRIFAIGGPCQTSRQQRGRPTGR